MIKIYYPFNPHISRAMWRIRTALIKHAPSEVMFVDEPSGNVIHILDWIGQHPEKQDGVLFKDVPSTPKTRKYVLLYHCWSGKSYERNNPVFKSIFENASLVITHSPFLTKYHLVFNPVDLNFDRVNWYVTCWGFDPDIFYPLNFKRRYMILATGYVKETELIDKVYEAVRKIRGKMVHVGGFIGLHQNNFYERHENIPDKKLNTLYNMSKYVSALRTHIGFEVVGIEGLACGCTPIYLNLPPYTYWFKEYALFINPEKAIEQLVDIFINNVKVHADREELRKRFSWHVIAKNIWSKILTSIT